MFSPDDGQAHRDRLKTLRDRIMTEPDGGKAASVDAVLELMKAVDWLIADVIQSD